MSRALHANFSSYDLVSGGWSDARSERYVSRNKLQRERKRQREREREREREKQRSGTRKYRIYFISTIFLPTESFLEI